MTPLKSVKQNIFSAGHKHICISHDSKKYMVCGGEITHIVMFLKPALSYGVNIDSCAYLHNPSAGISEFMIAALLVVKLLFTVNTDDTCHV